MRRLSVSSLAISGSLFTRGLLGLFFTLSFAAVAAAQTLTHAHAPDLGVVSVGWTEIALAANGGDGTNYVWDVAPGSDPLPPGLSLRTDRPWWFPPNAQAGLIGVAATPGVYNFTLRVSSGGQVAVQGYTLKISSLVVKDPYQVFDAFVGESYAYPLVAMRDGVVVAAATWTPTPGGYPTGISLSSSGVLQGIPTVAGDYNFSYSVSDGGETVNRGGRIIVNVVHITTPGSLPNATQFASYSATIAASGGSNTYRFDANGLPQGLTLDSSSGAITGTVNGGPGLWSFNVTATDTVNHVSTNKSMSIDVVGVPPTLPSIAPLGGTFQDCSLGNGCSQEVAVRSGGTAPFTWSATGLPLGMSIRWGSESTSGNVWPGDAEIWGNPTVAGLYDIVFTVTDATGATATNTFTLRVSPLVLSDSLQFNATLGSPYLESASRGRRSPSLHGVDHQWAPAARFNAGHDESPRQRHAGREREYRRAVPVHRFGRQHARPVERLVRRRPDHHHQRLLRSGNDSDRGPVPAAAIRLLRRSITWSVVDAATLPPNVSLSPAGMLIGTPSTLGTYTFVVQATDSSNSTNYARRQFTLVIAPCRSRPAIGSHLEMSVRSMAGQRPGCPWP